MLQNRARPLGHLVHTTELHILFYMNSREPFCWAKHVHNCTIIFSFSALGTKWTKIKFSVLGQYNTHRITLIILFYSLAVYIIRARMYLLFPLFLYIYYNFDENSQLIYLIVPFCRMASADEFEKLTLSCEWKGDFCKTNKKQQN